MAQLNHPRLRAAFKSVGYSEKDFINALSLEDVLTNLGHEDFDRDIFEQLWEQCQLNSKGETKIDIFIDNLIRAEAILMQKDAETASQPLLIQHFFNQSRRSYLSQA